MKWNLNLEREKYPFSLKNIRELKEGIPVGQAKLITFTWQPVRSESRMVMWSLGLWAFKSR